MKKVAIGCGSVALAVILIAVVIAVTKGPQWFRKGMEMVEREVRSSESVSGWKPGSDAPDALFPSQVATATRLSTAPSRGVAALNMTQDGQMAIYEAGAERVEVHVFPVTENERIGLLSLANDAYDRSSGVKSNVQINSRTLLKFPAGSFAIIQPPERMVVFAASRGTDLTEFVESFFTSLPPSSEGADSTLDEETPPVIDDGAPAFDVEAE